MPDDAALGTVAVLVLILWGALFAVVVLLILGDR